MKRDTQESKEIAKGDNSFRNSRLLSIQTRRAGRRVSISSMLPRVPRRMKDELGTERRATSARDSKPISIWTFPI